MDINLVVIILGIIISLIGVIGLIFCKMMRTLHKNEVGIMRQPGEGIHKGEPEYMKGFRESESEIDLQSNFYWSLRFALVFGIGLLILCFQYNL